MNFHDKSKVCKPIISSLLRQVAIGNT